MTYDSDSKGISYQAGFFILIAFALAGIFLASAITIPVWTQMTGQPFSEMTTDIMDPAYSNAAKLVQSITAIFGFLLPAIMTAYLLSKRPLRLLGFSPKIRLDQAVVATGLIVASMFVSSSLSWFTRQIPTPSDWQVIFARWETNYSRQVVAIIGLHDFKDYLLALVVMAFLPAFCEETLFRGGLQNFISRWTRAPWLSIIIVSLIFSAVHLSFYGFLSRLFLGIMLGWIYEYSGRLWLSVLAHFINNAIAITVLYAGINKKPIEQALAENESSYWGILALPIVVLLLVTFRRISFNTKNASQ